MNPKLTEMCSWKGFFDFGSATRNISTCSSVISLRLSKLFLIELMFRCEKKNIAMKMTNSAKDLHEYVNKFQRRGRMFTRNEQVLKLTCHERRTYSNQMQLTSIQI